MPFKAVITGITLLLVTSSRCQTANNTEPEAIGKPQAQISPNYDQSGSRLPGQSYDPYGQYGSQSGQYGNQNQYGSQSGQNPYSGGQYGQFGQRQYGQYDTSPRSPSGVGGFYSATNDIIPNQNPFYDPTITLGKGRNTYDTQQNTYGGGNVGGYAGGTYGVSGVNLDPGLEGLTENSFCPEFWVAHNNICYRFIKSPKRNWHDAKKICIAYNSNLVNVENTDKHSFILRHLILQDQKQNRYYLSAHQVGPNSWINEDGSPLVTVDDGFAYEKTDLDSDTFQENLQDTNRYFNRFDVPQRRDYNNPLYSIEKTRLVYGYSHQKERWVFIPTYDFETHLFICESRQLYTVNNINVLQDDLRGFDYGVEINTEYWKIPRGPYFINQPNDTIFDTGKRQNRNDVTVSCFAAGYPTPSYSWYKEEYVNDNLTYHKIDPLLDSRFTISGGNLIIYDPDQTKDQGTYHCVAENKFGKIRSESVALNFGYIMEFNLKRSPESGKSNWGHAMFCDPPQHYPDVKYYWCRDYFPNFVQEDQRVFVSNDGALYFSALEIVDHANYSCTVKGLVGEHGRNGPFFPLKIQPSQNYQDLIFANSFPKVFPAAPIAGAEVRFECMAFGYPVPSYNWTRREGNLPRRAYLINFNRVLIIPNATLNDNGEYICSTRNSRKAIEKSIVLNLQMKPNFTIPLRDKIKDPRGEVSFICEANAIPDVNYTWYKNAELLDREKMDRDKYIIQDNVLTVKYLDPEKDDGMYQCAAKNQLQTAYSSAQLRVLSMKPSFHKRPLEPELYAVYNGNTTIVCDPEAAPRPQFQWKKDGALIAHGGHRRISATGTLYISPTSRDDEGVYSCVATNSYGTDESRSRLIVLQELRFVEPLPPTTIAQVFDFLFLHCEVSYDYILDVAFIWKHNGQEVIESERIKTEQNSLHVFNVSLLDAGEYECIAKSSVNQISSKTNLIVMGPPGAPGGVKVIETKKTTARLEWLDGTENGSPIRYYTILGRTNWNKTWTLVQDYVYAQEFERYSGRKQADVANLTPWSGYEFSVCGVNDLGTGQQSAPSPLHNTDPDKPYIYPRDLGGGGGKIGDLSMRWTPLKQQEQNAPGIYYNISWRLHDDNNDRGEWAHSGLKQHGNTGKAVVQIPLNNYYTKYDVKVQAINNMGPGPESPWVVIYSAEDMPQVAPQQPIARGFNSTCLNVTWNPIEETREKVRGNLIGHRLKYWKKGYREEDAVYYLSRTRRPWALIVGLEPDTYYLVKVMAYNAAGEGPESERYLERTYRKAPQKPPSSVHVYGVNPSTIRVVWRYVGVTMEEEPIIGYKVRVWESDQDMATANDTVILIGNKLEAFVDTLTPGKSYKMRVLAFSNGGDGRMSSPTLHFQMGKTDAHNMATNLYLKKTILFGLLSVFYLFKMALY